MTLTCLSAITTIGLAIMLLLVMPRDQIPQIPDVQDDFPLQKKREFTQQKVDLENTRSKLHHRIDDFNNRCKNVDDGSEEDMKCQKEAAQLEAEKEKYSKAVVDFGKEMRATPIVLRLTNDSNQRDAYNYARVIDQLQVSTNWRYAVSEEGNTHCNIFAWDVTRAMGCEIPHWVNKNDPRASSAIDQDGGFIVKKEDAEELVVNATVDWLNKHGKEHGWKQISTPEPQNLAQNFANQGHPTIAIWENTRSTHGHIAVVRPGSIGWLDKNGQVGGDAEAQAGGLVKNAIHLVEGFNMKDSNKSIQYWYHD